MRSAANTLIRIVAWGSVIIGTLFTLMQVWILGAPMLLAGIGGILATNRNAGTAAQGTRDDASAEQPQDFMSQHQEEMGLFLPESDARSTSFLVTEDLQRLSDQSVDDLFEDSKDRH